MGKYEGQNVANDIIDGCTGIVDKNTAVKAVRAICRCFGGTLVYIPMMKTNGSTAEKIKAVLSGITGDRNGELILKKIMTLYGRSQVYIPFEASAFKNEFALEIYDRYDGHKEKIPDLVHEYNMSFNRIYKLWKLGRKLKLERRKEHDH